MKKLGFFLFLFVSSSFAVPTAAPGKYALIIAIGKYKWWNDLSSANDLALMRQTLERQGFLPQNIFTLKDEQATKTGIKEAFEKLIAQVPAGSTVVCHYSGHGQQISDNNGDELDGLDEAIVPYDAPMSLKQESGYDGMLHFRDDDLGEVVTRLRDKLGTQGHLLVLLDSCHSGSATRGSAKIRGGVAALILPNASLSTKINENGSGLFEGSSRGSSGVGLANYVVISGAKANEENREAKDEDGKPVGSLTYAVSRTWATLNGGQISYYEWFGRLMNTMAVSVPSQTPTIEGDFNATLLSGKYVKIKPYFNVAKILDRGDVIRVDAGQLMGIFEGTKVALYGKDPKPVAIGEVTQTNALLALVKLDKKLPETAIEKEYRVYVTEQTFGDLNVKLKTETTNKVLLDSLRTVPYIQLVKNEPIDLLLKDTVGGFRLYTAAEGLPFGKVVQTNSECVEQVTNYVQTKILKTVDLVPDSTLKVQMTVVPFEGKEDLWGKITKEKVGYPLGDIPSFREGMFADLVFKNSGQSTVYVTGVDIMANGGVGVLFPKNNEQPADYKIDAGQTKIVQIKFTPPFGTEIIKVYATTNAIDLRQIATTRGETRGAPKHPIEKFFKKSYGRTRSETFDPPPVQSGSVITYTFKMLEK